MCCCFKSIRTAAITSSFAVWNALVLPNQISLLDLLKDPHISAQQVQDAIKGGAKVNAIDAEGNTPLMMAAKFGNVEAAKVVLSAGAKCDLKNTRGMTALILAAQEGRGECVRALLDARADVNAKDKNGWTALMFAAANDRLGCAESLIGARANVNVRDKDGRTALMCAAAAKYAVCVGILLDAKADVRAELRTVRHVTVALVNDAGAVEGWAGADVHDNALTLTGQYTISENTETYPYTVKYAFTDRSRDTLRSILTVAGASPPTPKM